MAEKRTELKKCPFCGELDVNLRYAQYNDEILVNISCNRCGVEMPIEETIGEAVQAWNTRKGVRNGQ